jgi:hypothetical protein
MEAEASLGGEVPEKEIDTVEQKKKGSRGADGREGLKRHEHPSFCGIQVIRWSSDWRKEQQP